MNSNPINGIDRLLADQTICSRMRRGRVGLLSSQACHNAFGQSTALAVQSALSGTNGQGLIRLFAAEHGWTTAAAPGASVDDARDPQTGLPVHSVYGIRHRPDPAAIADLDTIIIDLRDIGVRCYTYATTAARFLAALADHPLEVVLCDRPNPLGSKPAGPVTDSDLRNFLAYFATPFLHGQTLGSLLQDFNRHLPNPCDLTVIPADKTEPGHAWHPPSPSLRDPHTIALYPGLVLLEGTNISEGRGTDRPFLSVLAPWLAPKALLRAAQDWPLNGLDLIPHTATPTTGKFADEICHGITFHLNDPSQVQGLAVGVHLIATLSQQPEFQWQPGKITPLTLPWQEAQTRPQQSGPFIDYLMGSDTLRVALANGVPPTQILASWDAALAPS